MTPLLCVVSPRSHQQAFITRNVYRLFFYPSHFLAPEEASFFYEQLLARAEFDPPEKTSVRRPFSKEKVPIPRMQAAYGDLGTSYRFSGITVHARPWIPILLELKEILERRSGCTPNFALLNYYRSGRDSIGWHSDDEKDLGTRPEIASLLFGATRDFQFRHKDDFGKKNQNRTLQTVTLPRAWLLVDHETSNQPELEASTTQAHGQSHGSRRPPQPDVAHDYTVKRTKGRIPIGDNDLMDRDQTVTYSSQNQSTRDHFSHGCVERQCITC